VESLQRENKKLKKSLKKNRFSHLFFFTLKDPTLFALY
jgi:hypothetical protein